MTGAAAMMMKYGFLLFRVKLSVAGLYVGVDEEHSTHTYAHTYIRTNTHTASAVCQEPD